MTIRYEANPPKILPDVNTEESIIKFVEKMKIISKKCDTIHITENVLGHQRVSPIKIGEIIKKEIPDTPITVSLRVRDKNNDEIIKFVETCISIGVAGILILMGDPAQSGAPDSGLVPSRVVTNLKEKGYNSKIKLYLSISNKPNFSKIVKKIKAQPNGFMTQVVQNIEQVQNLVNNLKQFSIIPIILFPSEKNQKSADFLGLNLEEYSKEFDKFVKEIHKITKDVLITSPNDFKGLNEYLKNNF
ncbi:MAG: 5,10-methenyltetrahydrofolate synthetase [Nitrosopumilus sp.]|jgi:homocysteine S-methyltransferase|nr:5,10-methenyltetrahydrofolate synthetase [Nitrosopumilus sp.]MBT3861782.1 5,10-methenyltetrahydrofolate synthetase [Nitrosopumilus sp.]MBT4535837.1 5,10-methenyltetrahydrofolate synthetase [Nitrosopumilus sp.]MBT4955895.1 5,10-methenyltetrahydrofolate synthetase [Nitrosopumilus sp.]MBT6194523.1 5,10-methenyltetrahydrofolate synthetase [Nitrosopumilus sp.]